MSGALTSWPNVDSSSAAQGDDRVLLEQVEVVLDVAADPVVTELQLEREIEARKPDVDRERRRSHAAQLERLTLLCLRSEVDLEDRVVAWVTFHLELFDDSLEREILMGVRLQRRLASSADDLAE